MDNKGAITQTSGRLYKLLRAGLPMAETKELSDYLASLNLPSTLLNQWEAKVDELKDKAIDRKEMVKTASTSPEAEELAELLRSYILELFPHYENQIKVEKWAKEIKKIPGQAKEFNFDVVRAVITWIFKFDTRDSEFWRKQIRSGDKLRKHFSRLYELAKEDFEDMKIDEV